MIDEDVSSVGPSENLLALMFEIKNALVHQNDRIASMSETVGESLRLAQSVLVEWETIVKKPSGGASSPRRAPRTARRGGRAMTVHQTLQDLTSGLRSLAGAGAAPEPPVRARASRLGPRREPPLGVPRSADRYVDDLYSAVTRRDGETRRTMLTLQTGGVGFEPRSAPSFSRSSSGCSRARGRAKRGARRRRSG